MTAQSDQSSSGRGWVLYLRLLTYVIHHKAVMLSGLLGVVVFAASAASAASCFGMKSAERLSPCPKQFSSERQMLLDTCFHI